MWQAEARSYLRVTAIYTVGFYLLPKTMGRTGRFIYDGLRLISFGFKQKQITQTLCKNPTLFWLQSVTSLRPPTASQWAAVRIKAYIGDIRNPLGVIPD